MRAPAWEEPAGRGGKTVAFFQEHSLCPERAAHASVGSSFKQARCFLSSSAQLSSPAQPPAHQPKFTHRDAGA
ncbi:hypothetical protein QQF64_021819 [Cirrhinus molitorella]|uniref:Uncharacterized protein n=1 Tax=Cirrhinus molitorella TaxID=172907 RepID=A0ABR3L918_9TELE